MSKSSQSAGKQARESRRSVTGRDFDGLRKRRMRAAEMFRRGKRQAEVASALEVSAQTASRWYRVWQDGGRAALAGAGRAGRKPKLSDEQLAEVAAELSKGPRAHGFATEMWTLARVVEVIECATGVRYSTTQTWTILRERLGWSRQRPARQAAERDDAAIEEWVTTEWPRIKKAPGAEGPGSVSKTKADSRCCQR